MALSGGSGAVFFLGTRAHYQVLEQPYDTENGNTSTETIYENTSVEELWPSDQRNAKEDKYVDRINWNLEPSDVNVSYEQQIHGGNHCIKRRIKRHSTEALLGDEMKPSLLNNVIDDEPPKHKSSRRTVMQFLSSLSRRKRRMPEQVQYLQHMDSSLITCTYRESCRCLDCQGRYFECAEDSEDYSSDDEDFNVLDLENSSEPNDEVFLEPGPRPEKTEKQAVATTEEQTQIEGGDPDKQLQLEVAASTSAMLNLLLYHPFSCVLQ